jgi:hypothetical protein
MPTELMSLAPGAPALMEPVGSMADEPDIDTGSDDYVMRVIARRCPEVADQVVPASTLEKVLDIIDGLTDRMGALEAQAAGQGASAGGQSEVEGQPLTAASADGRPRAS